MCRQFIWTHTLCEHETPIEETLDCADVLPGFGYCQTPQDPQVIRIVTMSKCKSCFFGTDASNGESRPKSTTDNALIAAPLGQVYRRVAEHRENHPEHDLDGIQCFSSTLDAPLHQSDMEFLTEVLWDLRTLYHLHTNRPYKEVPSPYFGGGRPTVEQLWLINQIRNACFTSQNMVKRKARLEKMANWFLGGPQPTYQSKELAAEDYHHTIRLVMIPVSLDDLPKDNPGDTESECTICKTPYGETASDASDSEEPEIPVRLPCTHVFGRDCLEAYVNNGRKLVCPYCRTDHTLEIGLRGRETLLDQREFSETPWWITMLRGA